MFSQSVSRTLLGEVPIVGTATWICPVTLVDGTTDRPESNQGRWPTAGRRPTVVRMLRLR